MNRTGWLRLGAALALVLAAAAGWSTGRLLAPSAEAQDAAPQPDATPLPANPPRQAAIPPQDQPQTAPVPSAEDRDVAHLASVLAPVALYPDPLLNNILAASTYPLEVVEADRWLDNPANAGLSGDQLESALLQKDWDPTVKSLVPFPAILKMMDNQLDWTQQLGDAFLARQDQVFDMVQQLRRQAQAAGGLVSTQQQRVATDQEGAVAIEPANPQEVSVPAYNPNAVYGDWPYPEAPPDQVAAYGPDIADLGYGDGWYFGPPIVIATPAWFWGHIDWHHHRIEVNRDRFARLDPPHRWTVPGEWQHDPTHRHGVAYREAGLQQRFQPERTAAFHPAPSAEPRSFAPPAPIGARPGMPQEAPHFGAAPGGRLPSMAPAPQPVQTMAHPNFAPPPQPVQTMAHPAMPAPAYHPMPAAPPRPMMQSAPPSVAAHPVMAPAHATSMPAGGMHGFAR